ncbi:plantaricin C family lantibiotic [Clostridium perfringens]|uniref:plantaricin C family lantibiotic n=1 Tax=Clostridium perfringens TaxID=1502 RepID=UPI0013E3E5DF|nr:plantaricin C family lantibiotic [Clostridium perfringens]MDU2325901.1 plantaricin C family lantibiotic [Clostridium perfringens]MDU2781960.1 plantaricin C family lantibiotic [Clostridium perfringens]MDU5649545.1 plantaricin C family lantibiotic [Clostridium perfringens]MEA5269115.1 plantaricin C family lantibiotic [Clostridium perfringens]MEA5272073.1 plantaricin C family lantibiotic [Clostridium perfringens]
MKFSKRNPLLRKNTEDFNKVVGDLGQDIQEQDLENIEGGSTPGCAAVAAVTAVGTVVAWGETVVTNKYKCGGVWSATAECFHC